MYVSIHIFTLKDAESQVFAWLSVNVRPCRADSSFACLTLSGSKHSTPSGKPLYSKLWKCIFPSCTAKQGGLNALKRALFFFKNSTKLILLPYKAVDFAINNRYFINRGEFSTHMRAKKNQSELSLCVYRRDFYELSTLILSLWSLWVYFLPSCIARKTRWSFCN